MILMTLILIWVIVTMTDGAPMQDPTEEYLEGMMSEAPGPINFTMFLTLFGERLQVGVGGASRRH